jgi:hypothetical protein
MPNIIEQQDILKGLPDARLAMLLQNPVGDIPPFLVAAEAQRREAIRQQFAGQPPKESVVESLTKQLARVPQNIQAPAQMPPMVPPTPQMAGVAALEQQQMMEQAAMNAQPQQMRHGGMVRRYQFGGFVAPVVPPTSSRVQDVAEQFGVSVEEAARMIANNPDIGGGKPEEAFGTPPKINESNSEPKASPLELELPAITISPYEKEQRDRERFREAKYNEMDNYGGYTGKSPIGAKGMSAEEIARENQRLLQRLNKTGQNINPLGEEDQQPGETEDEFRARIEALYAANEPSDWEKSQRWFAMAEQFLDPSKTTMQSVAGAGRAFADQSAAMAAAERQAQREAEKALLEYDMSQYKSRKDAEREAAIAERSRTSMSAEKYADVLSRRLDAIDKIIESKAKQITDSAMPLSPEEQAQINAEIQKLNLSREQVAGLLASLGEASYGPVPYETYNLGKGFRP